MSGPAGGSRAPTICTWWSTRSTDWAVWLVFRDHLRDHPADAAEYARVKRELAAADPHDRSAYRAGKAPFIQDLVRRIAPRT